MARTLNAMRNDLWRKNKRRHEKLVMYRIARDMGLALLLIIVALIVGGMLQ